MAPVNAPLLWPNSSASQLGGERGAVEAHERLVGAPRRHHQRLGHPLFAGAALAVSRTVTSRGAPCTSTASRLMPVTKKLTIARG